MIEIVAKIKATNLQARKSSERVGFLCAKRDGYWCFSAEINSWRRLRFPMIFRPVLKQKPHRKEAVFFIKVIEVETLI